MCHYAVAITTIKLHRCKNVLGVGGGTSGSGGAHLEVGGHILKWGGTSRSPAFPMFDVPAVVTDRKATDGR